MIYDCVALRKQSERKNVEFKGYETRVEFKGYENNSQFYGNVITNGQIMKVLICTFMNKCTRLSLNNQEDDIARL